VELMAQFLVLPLQLWDDDREAFKRAIDGYFVDGPAPAGTPVPPIVTAFLEAHAAPLRAFYRANWPKRGPGFLYLHWRLDEAPPDAPDLDWAKTLTTTTIAGYPVVYVPVTAVPHMRAMADLVRRYGSPTTMVIHCRTAHAVEPETQDQPYAVVVQPGGDGNDNAAPAASPA
jgi:hypothetical protein